MERVDEAQLGLRLKELNRYAFKSEVYEGNIIYVVSDGEKRQRLHKSGYFELVELDPREHVILEHKGRTIAVRDPMTAARLAIGSETPQVHRKPRIRTKTKDADKPKEIQVGEASPEPIDAATRRQQLLDELAALDDAEDEEPLPDDVHDDTPGGVEV